MLQESHVDIVIADRHESIRALFVIPVFNDWASLATLLGSLDLALMDQGVRADVLVVDDASTVILEKSLLLRTFHAIDQISVLELKRNLGHQRTIAIGLAYVEAHYSADMVVVMDSDGEESPGSCFRDLEPLRRRYSHKLSGLWAKVSKTFLHK